MENMQNVTAALDALGVKTCLACGKAGAKSLCMGCKTVYFCGKACQTQAWPGHKRECRRIVREKAEAKYRLEGPIAAAFAADEAMAADECWPVRSAPSRGGHAFRRRFLDARRGQPCFLPRRGRARTLRRGVSRRAARRPDAGRRHGPVRNSAL